jgi:Arc/MetJ family transcription regulator
VGRLLPIAGKFVYCAYEFVHTLRMRTNIDIDDELMETALRESGLRTKRAAVEEGLRALIERQRRKRLIEAFGKYPWDGDLAEMRRWRSEKLG